MAVFMDHRCQAPYKGQMTDIQWHKSSPILAVATQGQSGVGILNFFLEEGEHIQDCILKKPRPVSAICWHPTKRAIAVGWESGDICVWNEQERETFDVQSVHRSEVSILQWTSNGTKLLSGDAQGQLALWKADSRGRLQQVPIVSHSLGETLTHAVLRPPPPQDPATDIASLARAAVSGDEAALDMFAWKGKSSTKLASSGTTEAVCFFIGGQNGSVYYLNEAGTVTQQFTAEAPVRKLLYYEERNILITVTTNMMLTQHAVTHDGDTREILMVKLSGKPDNADMIWAGKGILATCTGESVIRMWDIDKEENFILNLESHPGYEKNESINCLSFGSKKNILAAGTTSGNVAMFKYFPYFSNTAVEPEDLWKLQPPCVVSGPISDVAWGSSKDLLAVNTVESVVILNEQVMSANFCDETVVMQTGPMSLSVDVFSSMQHHDLKADIQIKGVCTTKDCIALWDGKQVVVYEITGDGSLIRAAGTFGCHTPLLCIFEQNVYTVDTGERGSSKIEVRTFQGTVKQLLAFTDVEGIPNYMAVCTQYLICTTTNGFIKLYDLGRREAKAIGSPKNMLDVVPDIHSIVSAKVNCNGTKVSIIINRGNGEPDCHLYVWDVDLDTVQFFNFETGHGEQDEYTMEGPEREMSNQEKGKHQAAKDISGRHPISHYWDTQEPKLMCCEARIHHMDKPGQAQADNTPRGDITLMKKALIEVVEVMIVSLFVTPEHGILIQDSFPMGKTHSSLLALQVPFFYFSKKLDLTQEELAAEDEERPFGAEATKPQTPLSIHNEDATGAVNIAKTESEKARTHFAVSRKVMRDFVGLENAEQSARDAMMNFSYFLTIGNMDEAFKAIKLIKTESVWENMARMCVKTRRLDVASVCLGNMSHARGAKALREAAKEEQLDAKVAVLAMQLGQNDDAERLLKNCKRYDLLNTFYQASGQWNRAIETAEMYDRIHLRTTYYNYAKYLEGKGDVNAAIPNYEKSDTHRFEVPRMLYAEPQSLVAYISKNKDKALNKWYAQFMESNGEQETALRYYEAADDCLQRVRVHCYCGNLDQAAEICNSTGDRAACYHLAREYENKEQYTEAVHFYTRAGAYGNAIRLSRDSGNDDQLMNLALLGKPEDMLEAARTYEFQPKNQDKAVMLYHKAGYFSKALDLAFNTKQFAALQIISEDLDENTDPELVARCADFFIENSQFDRAVDLLAVAKKYWEALKICMEQHVDMTEELVEKLTPAKEEGGKFDDEERNKILEGIAEVCMQQRQYHLATKKYTQAGNKLKAMKALLKSGDTEKIVFFAGVSRQREIYILAANYLQSLDWRKDPDIMKNIIGFYTKGRALDSLSSFYDACGMVEIDEYQNYDKALGALSEAYKCLTKAKMDDQTQQETRLNDLKYRMELIKRFVQIKRGYGEDNEEAIKQCQALLAEHNIDHAVRIGDIYGFLVEHFARKDKMKAAWNCMEEMRNRIPNVNMSYYIDMKTLTAIHKALDIPMTGLTGPVDDDAGSGEEINEDVPEETGGFMFD